MPKDKTVTTKLVEDRDALGFNVQDACEEPLMRIEQAAGVLLLVHERIFSADPGAADAVALAQSTIDGEVDALRRALCVSRTKSEDAA